MAPPRCSARRSLTGRIGRWPLAVAAVLALAVAATPGAREEWFDHYERGLSAIEAGRGDDAVAALERALEQQPESGFRRTYGNNYIRYLPRFHLARAHALRGDCDAVRRWLDASRQAGEEDPDQPLAPRREELARACAAPSAPPSASGTDDGDDAREAERRRREQLAAALRAGLEALAHGLSARAVERLEPLADAHPDVARIQIALAAACHAAWVERGAKPDDPLRARGARALAAARRADPALAPDPRLFSPRITELASEPERGRPRPAQ